jgi:GNAT superfamily N-acetyltransferase
VNSAHDAPVIHALPYDHPDVQALVEGLQQLYVEIYGGRDESPIDAAEFEVPRGAFAVAYLPGSGSGSGSGSATPVGMGAWRLLPDGRGELKRLFVRPGHRGRGVSRALLGWLEDSARASGVAWMVLETNTAHPEAIQLYRSAGYEAVADYGHYADEPETVSLGREL